MAKRKGERKPAFGQTIITEPGRLVFPNIATPTAIKEDAELKYSANLVVKPSGNLDLLKAEIEKVGQEFFGDSWSDQHYRPILTGEEILKKILAAKREKGDDSEIGDQTQELYAGRFRILAKGSSDKPAPDCFIYNFQTKVPDKMPRRPGNGEDLKAVEAQFYAGCYCRLAVTPFSFSVMGSKGVGLILKGIQFLKDGTRLGGVDLNAAFSAEIDDDYQFEEDEVSSGFSGAPESVGDINI